MLGRGATGEEVSFVYFLEQVPQGGELEKCGQKVLESCDGETGEVCLGERGDVSTERYWRSLMGGRGLC